MKTAQVTHLKLPPELLERGFWIYIWQIRLPTGCTVHYVGMTGDTGSYRAQSPFRESRTISDSTSGEIHCGAI